MNRIWIGAVTLLAGALLLGGPVHAQDEQSLRQELQSRAAQSGLTSPQIDAILARADRVAAADLPVRPILDRYLEGLAKGIPLPRIEAVVDKLEVRLRESAEHVDRVFPVRGEGEGRQRQAADRSDRMVLVEHGAYALAVGVPPDGIEEAMRLAAQEHEGPGAGAAPVLAMGCLVAGGLQADASFEVVRTAWTHGYRGSDLERLGQDLGSLGREGAGAPPALIDRVLGSIRAGEDRERIFRDLDALGGAGPPGPGQPPPGVRPGEDPSHMHGPSGPPPPPPPHHHGDGGREG